MVALQTTRRPPVPTYAVSMGPVSMPIVDLRSHDAAAAIDAACRRFGFFAVSNHGTPDELRVALLNAAAEFFALPRSVKDAVSLAHGGTAWRGWFPLEGELTSGVPDLKEGYYFGTEGPPSSRPLHGPNVWPERPASMRRLVSEWMAAMHGIGQHILSLMAQGLGLPRSFFVDGLTGEATELFRIFRYPPQSPRSATGADDNRWGVGEHTDYGLLTLLAHDGSAGLEVKVGERWLEAPDDPALIVCNLGDMLDRLTSGRYRSTPHRVRNLNTVDRYSLPYFLDPGWDAIVDPLPIDDDFRVSADASARWDRTDLQQISGTYGDWLWTKVSKVFPDLASQAD